ncbi:MAG TPA: hypothetical protein PLU35_10715 [Phycisphaerales bacterium]|nr:hypothetical protein [Phycisphaerales bacterium]
MVGRVVETLGGLYALVRLGFITRFRFGGQYWRWRLHTAFGGGMPESRVESVRAVVRYGRWMHRMRRLG